MDEEDGKTSLKREVEGNVEIESAEEEAILGQDQRNFDVEKLGMKKTNGKEKWQSSSCATQNTADAWTIYWIEYFKFKFNHFDFVILN